MATLMTAIPFQSKRARKPIIPIPMEVPKVAPFTIPKRNDNLPLDPQTEVFHPTALVINEIRNVAIFKLDHVGDCYYTLPSIERLKERLPYAKFTLFCGPWAIPIFNRYDFLKIIPIDFYGENAMNMKKLEITPEETVLLQKDEFDLVIDFRYYPDNRELIGKNVKSKFYAAVTPISHKETIHISPTVVRDVIHGRMIAALVGYLPIVRPAIPYDPDKAICLAYNASSKFKLWNINNMVKLGEELLAMGFRVVVGYSPTQATQTENLAKHLGVPLLRGNSIQDYVDRVLDQCSVYLGFDTGPSHAIAAAGLPIVTIMGNLVSVPPWVPLGPKVTTLHKNMGRPPCGNAYTCPCNHTCTDVPVADVKWAILESMK